MIKKITNKKGDIPVTVFTIAVVVLLIFSLVTFAISKSRAGTKLVDTTILQDINAKIEQYSFYKNLGLGNEEIFENIGAKKDALGREYLYNSDSDGKLYVYYYLPQ